MTQRLIIKVATGFQDLERCNQALTVAMTAVVSGVSVSLWLAGDAAWLAVPGRTNEFDMDGTPPAQDLINAVLAGGTVTLCARCADRRGIAEAEIVPGIILAGAASFVAEVTEPNTSSLVY